MYNNENLSDKSDNRNNYFKEDVTSDKKVNFLKKEPGLNSLVQAEGRDKAINSNMMANTYLNTYNSLKEHYNEVRDTNPVLAEKIQKDLSDFYKSVGNRFNTTIRSESDFEDLINAVRSSDDVKRELKNSALTKNQSVIKQINKLRESDSPVSTQLKKMLDRKDEIDDNLRKMASSTSSKTISEEDKEKEDQSSGDRNNALENGEC